MTVVEHPAVVSRHLPDDLAAPGVEREHFEGVALVRALRRGVEVDLPRPKMFRRRRTRYHPTLDVRG